jgi:hypothetical protein
MNKDRQTLLTHTFRNQKALPLSQDDLLKMNNGNDVDVYSISIPSDKKKAALVRLAPQLKATLTFVD